MNNNFYYEKWNKIKNNTPDIGKVSKIAKQIAFSFMDGYLQNGSYEEKFITMLCEMATFSNKPEINAPAAKALFGIIVESLCDDFEELQTKTYNRVMAQVISYCRNLEIGKELDSCLKKFGINSHQELLQYVEKVRNNNNKLDNSAPIKKIILLSRVTIGADIAITSVIIQRVNKEFPNAQIIIIGPDKLKEIYSANTKITIKPVPYKRRGGLMERLKSWHLVLEYIQEEISSSSLDNVVVLDPDSRLSQLGVLPLISLSNYYFFPSRSVNYFNSTMSMPEITNMWLDSIFKTKSFHYPNVWHLNKNREKALLFYKQLRQYNKYKIIMINFGVGGNPRKTLGQEFETKLLLTLLKEPNTIIILDKGFGEQEEKYADELLEKVELYKFSREDIDFSRINLYNQEINFSNRNIIGIQSTIGEMSALISQSDEYIGYDSAGQHIAVATKIPCLTIFAGSNNTHFTRRWSAYGKNYSNIIHVDTLSNPNFIDIENIISRIMYIRKSRENNGNTGKK